ncbi:MAG: hypothetical protein ACLU5I_08825 [Alistipes finegoldii]
MRFPRGLCDLRRSVRFKDEFIKRYKLFAADLEAEFRLREPNFKITLNEMPQVDRVLDARTQFDWSIRWWAQRRDRHVARPCRGWSRPRPTSLR